MGLASAKIKPKIFSSEDEMNDSTKNTILTVAITSFLASPMFFVPLTFALFQVYTAPFPIISWIIALVAVVVSWFYFGKFKVGFKDALAWWDGLSLFLLFVSLFGTQQSPSLGLDQLTNITFAYIIYLGSIFQVAIHLILVLIMFLYGETAEADKE